MTTNYSLVARTLHWLVAGLIIAQYIIAELAENSEHRNSVVQQLGLLANHKSIGMTILGLALIRVLWRLFNAPPPLPQAMPTWQMHVSNTAHIALYGFLFALPLTGWLMSSAKSYSVSWFNLFVFPDLIAASESNAERLETMHKWLGEALLVLAVIHFLAALKHHFIDKDSVLSRMASRAGYLVLVATIVLTLTMFGRVSVSQKSAASLVSETVTQRSDITDKDSKSDLPVWDINYQDSYIEFSGEQAGAPFNGRWQQWRADLQFDVRQLESARFSVIIEPASVASGDTDRDNYIRDADFFDVENYPQASFIAQQFYRNESGGFVATGQLTMKNISHPVDLEFTVSLQQGLTVLEGHTVLDRFAWNIGMGDWTDTSWVGKDIRVKVRVATK